MSVAAQSPFVGSLKRQFEPDHSPSSSFGSAKRSRGSPTGACSPVSGNCAYAVSVWALAALHKLFPGVEEKVMRDTLEECNNDVDATIKRLHVLCLVPDKTDMPPVLPDRASCCGDSSGSHPAADSGAAGRECEEAAELKQPQTPEEWVEALVEQMSAAKNIDDARQRAARVLQAFEKVVLTTAQAKVVDDLRAQVEALTKDNGILKRAVAIQNGRLQEVAPKDEELRTLRATVQQYQEKLQSLQMSNYSLAMHLRQATEPGRFMSGQHNPDVF